MAEFTDRWLWFVDDQLVEQLAEVVEPAELSAPAVEAARPAKISATGDALRLHTEGKTGEALEVLKRAIEKGEDLPDLYALTGHIKVGMQDFEGAAAAYRNLLALEPAHRTAGHNLGVALEQLGRHGDALEAFDQSRKANPGLWQSTLGAAVCCLHLERHEAALAAFDACLAARPDCEKAEFGKAVALQSLGRVDEAQELYRKLLPNNANNPELLGNLVALSAARKDSARLREYSDRLLKLRPQSKVALEGLVAASLARGDFKSAAQYGSQLVKVASDSWEAWYNFGYASHKLSRLEQATQAYEKASRIKEEGGVFANLGLVLEERTDIEGARRAMEKAIELAPSNPGPLWNLALFYDRQGDAEGAELALEQLIEIKPEHGVAWFRLGQKRFGRGDFGPAAEAYYFALKHRAEDWPEAWLNLGLARYQVKDIAGAREALDKAAEAGQPEAWKALAAISVDSEDPAAAEGFYQKACDLGVRSPALAYNIGLAFQKSGDAASAARWYAEAVELDPNCGEALLNLGHALDALGHKDDARQCWAKALEVQPGFAETYFA